MLYHLLLLAYIFTLIYFINSFLIVFYFVNGLFKRKSEVNISEYENILNQPFFTVEVEWKE